jgi:hypothetical protein
VSVTTQRNCSLRPEERRRNPRLRVSSLIYAQLGSDNGGIVVNLGMDGMACQAAHNLIADKNSLIHLKLRGSGLHAELTGELVWLAGTQKEVGISFKSLPADVQQNIADWMGRESQPTTPAGSEQRLQQKSISAIADMAVPEKRTIPRSLSAALALSRSMSLDHASPAPEAVHHPDVSVRVESVPGILPLAPTSEIFPAVENSNAAAEQVKDRIEDHGQFIESNSHCAAESPDKCHVLNNPPIAGEPPAHEPARWQAQVRKEIAAPKKPLEMAHSVPPHAPNELRKNIKIGKNAAADSAVGAAISRIWKRSRGVMVAEKWIPQAFLFAWKRLSVQQKKLLTHMGAGCVGLSIGLLLVLAVTLSHGFSARSSVSKPTQQSSIPAVLPEGKTADIQDSQDQGSAAQSTISSASQPQNHQPESQPSFLSKIANSILGNEADGTHKISDYQMGLEVWTSQSSGYYYCSDDPYAKFVQPGKPMLQGDALQSGYRPRLGQFCN